MAKNTVYGGPSIADVTPVVPTHEDYDAAVERLADGGDAPVDRLIVQDYEEHQRRLALDPHAPAPEAPERSAMALDAAADEESEGGEDVSAGKSSSTSDEKPSSSTEKGKSDSQSPARTTESRSGQAPAGSSTARTTGGGTSAKH